MTLSPALLDDAYLRAGGFDEMSDGHGGVRTSWTKVAASLRDLGLEGLSAARREADQLLDDDGVSYRRAHFDEAEDAPDRWRLDPVPLVIDAAEWATIEAGVLQRAELLNLVLTDLLGPRDLLRRGFIPPELVLGHPGFLRVATDATLPGFRQLFTVASDLVRDASGRMLALSDRTQAPSGAAYALENRAVISRVLADVHRDAHVRRLAPYVRALRSGLQALAPETEADPRLVVLSPGARSETAFEHAYLASTLGATLVEGRDLTYRDGVMWLRALGRPERVDVIHRRVDSWWCDPLELRPDSQLGTPGLVEAARTGAVAVANSLGSGVLENPALQAYLPAICEALLGQPLHIEPVATFWCGDEGALQHVLSALDRWVLKPIARRGSAPPVFAAELSRPERDALRDRIRSEPRRWVAQEALRPATVPTLHEGRLVPRGSVLRTFVVASDDSYVAMPGGLTRVAASDESAIANHFGAWSKDTWVLASAPERLSRFWLQDPLAGQLTPAVPDAAMSSRAAEQLFWIGRYAERAESVVRLVRVVEDRRREFADATSTAGAAAVNALLCALTDLTMTWPGFHGPDRVSDIDEELRSLVGDDERTGTLAFAVRRLVESAHGVRDQLSGDTWMVVNTLERELLMRHHPVTAARPSHSGLGRILTALLALQGLGAESFVRDAGWQFLDAGRRIERALQLVTLLRATLVEELPRAEASLVLESVLVSAESIITYRRRYHSRARVATILDLLVTDRENPRSLAWQVDRLIERVRELPGPVDGEVSLAVQLAEELGAAVRSLDTARLAESASGRRDEFAVLLGHVRSLLRQTSDALTAAWFVHEAPQRSIDGELIAAMFGETAS